MNSERSTLEGNVRSCPMVGPNYRIDVKISLFLIIYMTVKYYSLVSVGLLIGLLCATQPDPVEELLRALLGASRW